MLPSVVDDFKRTYGENKNLRKVQLLKDLNNIVAGLDSQSFCAKTLLSDRALRNIKSYKTEKFEFKTLAAIFIAFGVTLEQAERLFHLAGYHLNDSPFHCVVRFSLENNLSIDDADELLFLITQKHFYQDRKYHDREKSQNL